MTINDGATKYVDGFSYNESCQHMWEKDNEEKNSYVCLKCYRVKTINKKTIEFYDLNGKRYLVKRLKIVR